MLPSKDRSRGAGSAGGGATATGPTPTCEAGKSCARADTDAVMPAASIAIRARFIAVAVKGNLVCGAVRMVVGHARHLPGATKPSFRKLQESRKKARSLPPH